MSSDDSRDREDTPTSPTGTVAAGSSADRTFQPGTVLAERYEIRQLVGSGGMGEVWRAYDRKLEIDVALKALRPEFYGSDRRRELLRKEVRAAREVVSQNVCRVFDLVVENELELISMELVEGRTLGRVLKERGPLEPAEASRIAGGFLAGLQAVHDAGLVHRDFKPDNVMITSSGRVVVMDFGIARSVDLGSGTIAGTPAYMSPEQMLGKADARSDVFSAGVVLAEMVSPEGTKDRDSRERIWEGIRSDPPQVSAGPLGPVVRRAVSTDPADRFPTARSMAAALGGKVEEKTKGVSRKWVASLAVAVSLVAGLVGLATLGLEWWRARGGVDSAAPATTLASIVALPATVHAAEPQAFLADAVPSSLSSHLSRVEGLETKLPPSSDDLARIGGDLDKVAEAFGVDGFVMSRVTEQGSTLILGVQLVRAQSRSVLWSGEYEATSDTYLEMVRRAARELTAQLRPQAAPVQAARGSRNSAAELAFRKGTFHSDRFHHAERDADFELARESLERALEIEPERADAAAHMAWLLIYRYQKEQRQESGGQLLPEIEGWVERALESDPRSGMAWVARSYLVGRTRPSQSFDEVLDLGLKGVHFEPELGRLHNHLAAVLRARSSALALEAARRVTTLDPLFMVGHANEAEILTSLGRIGESIVVYDRALAIEPDAFISLGYKAVALALAGRVEETVFLETRLAELEEHIPPAYMAMYRDVKAIAMDAPGAEAGRIRLVAVASGRAGFPSWRELRQIAPWLAQLGEVDAALDVLEARADAGVVDQYDMIWLNPAFAPIQNDPRFVRVSEKWRPSFEELLARLDGAEDRGELPSYLGRVKSELRVQLGLAR